MAKVNEWSHSFDCKHSLYELTLEGGTQKARTKLKSLLVVWDILEVTARELDQALERCWIEREFDFVNGGERIQAAFKFSQDAGGITCAWVLTCLNQAHVCSARYGAISAPE